MIGCTVQNCFVGVGTEADPQINLVNSASSTFENVGSEGGNSPVVMHMEDCKNIAVRNCNFGFPPLQDPDPQLGVASIEMEDCLGCVIDGLPLWTGMPSIAAAGVDLFRVTMDAGCFGNTVTVYVSGTDTLADAVDDNGTDNTVVVINTTTPEVLVPA